MQIDFHLLKLLSSKLCHDLIQPVNSIKFSIDMINEDKNANKEFEINNEALAIAGDSINNLVYRLVYFRMALGGASLGDGEVALHRSKELIFDIFKEKAVKIFWDKQVDELLLLAASNNNLKVLLNIFLVIFYVVQKNSTVTVYCSHMEETNQVGLAIVIKGNNIKLGLDNLQALRMEVNENELTPRNVQCYYTALLAKSLNIDLEVRDSMQGEIQIACVFNK